MLPATPFGIWGKGLLGSNLTQFLQMLPQMRGFNIRYGWNGFETGRGTFSNSYLTDQIAILIAHDVYIGFGEFVSPNSSGYTPSYLFSAPDSVPLVTTSTGQTFQYYLNNNYKLRFFNLRDTTIPVIAAYASQQQYFIYWQSMESSTGDYNAYKGTVAGVTINGVPQANPNAYAITIPQWQTEKRTNIWPQMYSALGSSLPSVNMLINPDNDRKDLAWAEGAIPNVWVKFGFPGHNFNLPGESFYVQSGDALRAKSYWANRVRTELEGTLSASWFQASYKGNLNAIIWSCIHHGIDILQISPADSNTMVGSDLTAYALGNEFFGVRTAVETDRGICVFRQMIDVADTTKYSTGTYGTLVASADQAAYDAAVLAIQNSGDPQTVINDNLVTLLCQGKTGGASYINPARITALRAAFPTAAYRTITTAAADESQDALNQDFGVYMIADNYYRFTRQYKPDNTSFGIWRRGFVTSFWYRFGRQIDSSLSGKTTIHMFADELVSNHNYVVRIIVCYYDLNATQWQLEYFNGGSVTVAGTVTNNNSGNDIIHTFNIADFQGGGHLTNACDYRIVATSGSTIFRYVKFIRVSQNGSPIPPTAIIANDDQTITLPTSLVTMDASGSTAGTGTITGYLWTLLTGNPCTINSPTSAITTITFTTEGERTFQVQVTNSSALTNTATARVTVNPQVINIPPTADAGIDQTVSGLATVVDGSGSIANGGATLKSYSWTSSIQLSFADSSNIVTLISSSVAGTFDVTLEVTDSNGLTDTDTLQITFNQVNPTPMPQIGTYIEYGKICQYLSQKDISYNKAFTGGAINQFLPQEIYLTRKAVEWLYQLNPSDATLTVTANYLYALCGKYISQAKVIIGNSGGIVVVSGGGSVSGSLAFSSPSFVVQAAGAPIVGIGMDDGDTVLTIQATNPFQGSALVVVDGNVIDYGTTTDRRRFTAAYSGTTLIITFNTPVVQDQAIMIQFAYVTQ